MRLRRSAAIAGIALSLSVVEAPAIPAWAQTAAQPSTDSPVIAKVLPVAAGALIGAAAGFFILPLVVSTGSASAAAGAAAAVGPVTSPWFGVIGASVGGFVGSRFIP